MPRRLLGPPVVADAAISRSGRANGPGTTRASAISASTVIVQATGAATVGSSPASDQERQRQLLGLIEPRLGRRPGRVVHDFALTIEDEGLDTALAQPVGAQADDHFLGLAPAR